MQQILDELGALRGITIAVQALGAKLDAVSRQVGTPGERDPGDAVSIRRLRRRHYMSVKLDAPSFAAPIFCSLVETDTEGSFNLLWSH